MRKLTHLLLLLLMLLTFALPVVVMSQDEGEGANEDTTAEVIQQEGTSEEETPEGIGLLFLLIGLGGVFFVGVASIGKDRFTQAIETVQEAGEKL